MHFGEITFGVDERGEVGLLTRNIRIQASDDAETLLLRRAHHGDGRVEDVCLRRRADRAWGRTCTWPAIRSTGTSSARARGNTSENSSIHDTYSRCVTVHGTNNVRVENNVTFNTVGHCFFLEDAVETGNQFVHNLGIHDQVPSRRQALRADQPRPVAACESGTAGQSAKDILIPSDNTASTFWITNPDNIYRDNVAAGSDADRLLVRLAGASDGRVPEGTESSKNIWPRRTAVAASSAAIPPTRISTA